MVTPKHGGRRTGAGRPVGSGRYGGEATRVMRIPDSLVPLTQRTLKEHARKCRLPAADGVQSRPAKPAPDMVELQGFGRDAFLYDISNDELTPVGIRRGDQLVVDRKRTPNGGDVVLVWRASEGPSVKLLRRRRGAEYLQSGDRVLRFDQAAGDQIWGVVTGVVQPMKVGR